MNILMPTNLLIDCLFLLNTIISWCTVLPVLSSGKVEEKKDSCWFKTGLPEILVSESSGHTFLNRISALSPFILLQQIMHRFTATHLEIKRNYFFKGIGIFLHETKLDLSCTDLLEIYIRVPRVSINFSWSIHDLLSELHQKFGGICQPQKLTSKSSREKEIKTSPYPLCHIRTTSQQRAVPQYSFSKFHFLFSKTVTHLYLPFPVSTVAHH